MPERRNKHLLYKALSLAGDYKGCELILKFCRNIVRTVMPENNRKL